MFGVMLCHWSENKLAKRTRVLINALVFNVTNSRRGGMMMIEKKAIALQKEIIRSDLSPAARSVLNCLVRSANASGKCSVAVSAMIDESGFSDRTVRSKIKELTQKGWITREEQYAASGFQLPNVYRLNLWAKKKEQP